MKLNEIAVEYHKTLNKKLWKDDKLIPEVRVGLIKIAKKFVEFLKIDNSFIEDVIITGSNCNYNYTSSSDIDLHIVLSYKDFQSKCHVVDIEEMFAAKKNLWNNEHDITIFEIPVELYVQDNIGNKSVDKVTYSIVTNGWINPPHKNADLSVSDDEVNIKYQIVSKEIKELIKNKVDDPAKIKDLGDRIKAMRKSGLEKVGEFSLENLVFKKLKKMGLMDELYAYTNELENNSLSID